MTAPISFDEPSGDGLRRRLRESQWRTVLGAAGSPRVPAWAEPMTPPDEIADAVGADAVGADAADPGLPGDAVVDPALVEAAWMRPAALIEVEVAVTAGDRGLCALVWAGTGSGSSVVRGIDVAAGEGPPAIRQRPGMEVSAFGVGGLLDEVLRLVPPAPVSTPAPAATIPEEITITLAKAVRTGNARLLDAVCRDLRLAEPPPLVMAVVGSMDGSVVLTVRSAGRTDVSMLSLLRCSAGWVELVRTPDQQVRHEPRSAADITRMLLFDLTGRMDTALTALATTTQEESA